MINCYPNESPNDILSRIEYSPNYSNKSFDSIFRTLDYQIEDCRSQLNNRNNNFDENNDIEVQISNREYAKNKLSEICGKYFEAERKYKHFWESNKNIFDLYAGQNVKDAIVGFEVIKHNVFIAGNSVENEYYSFNNIDMSRKELTNNIRKELGVNGNI